MSVVQVANVYKAKHAVALKDLIIEHPSGRTFRVEPGMIFVSSPDIARVAALAGLVRAVDPVADRYAAVSSGDRALFNEHGPGF